MEAADKMTSSSRASRVAPGDSPTANPSRQLMTDGRGHDCQILVVGTGIAATVTAGFLDQAGLDPVVAPTPARSPQSHSNAVLLWRPVQALLERLGLRRPVQRLGTPIDEMVCLTSGESWFADRTDQPALIAVQYDELVALCKQTLLGGLRTTEHTVTAVTSTDTGVRATFSHGVEESFDAVITTAPDSITSQNQALAAPNLHSWQFEWPTPASRPAIPTEAWADSRAVFCVPDGENTYAQLLSARDSDAASVSTAELEQAFGQLFAADTAPFTDLSHQEITYSQQTLHTPVSMCTETTALVGPAAHGTIPGDGLGLSLTLEDAWVIADALAYGPARIADALTEYTTRRRRRKTHLASQFEDAISAIEMPETLSPPLRHVRVNRALALGRLGQYQYGTPDGPIIDHL